MNPSSNSISNPNAYESMVAEMEAMQREHALFKTFTEVQGCERVRDARGRRQVEKEQGTYLGRAFQRGCI